MPTNTNNQEVKQFVAPVGNSDYDLNAHRDATTMKAVAAVYRILGENADKLAFKGDADGTVIGRTIDDVAEQVMGAIIDNNVPDADIQQMIQNFQTALQLIFTAVAKTKNGFQDELLARVVGTRNPKEGTFSREYSTVGDMYLALDRVRESQGNNPLDYYFQQPAPEADAVPTETAASEPAPADEAEAVDPAA